MCIVIDTFCTQKNLIITCAIAQFGIERTHTAPSHLHTQSPSLTHSRTHTLSHTMSMTMLFDSLFFLPTAHKNSLYCYGGLSGDSREAGLQLQCWSVQCSWSAFRAAIADGP